MIKWDAQAFKSVALPHAVKVAIYIFISAGLTALLDYLAKLSLNTTQFILISAVINSVLSFLKKYSDEVA